ncbi:hypothetical protein AXX17_ATUG00440 [Arabidopsis thaliana]|uniref:Uncharacterized protein n=1 Tax=Arabidopsis thaliana TaxID=3702 RepID=A0A178U8L7_ARATH|nr:hypothetical protein AXX17_ATUG00440 [Arabidopsis thaliana]
MIGLSQLTRLTIGLSDPIRLADPIYPTISLADLNRRSVYQIRFVSKANGLPSPSSTLHRTVGPGGSMRISSVDLYTPSRTPFPTNNFRMCWDCFENVLWCLDVVVDALGVLPYIGGEWMLPETSHPFLAPFRKVTSVPCIFPKGHICSLHPLGDATVRWYPLDLTPFGRDTSSPGVNGCFPKNHIRSLHPSERSHPFLASYGRCNRSLVPVRPYAFGRDTSSPVSYHSLPARVSADRTIQLGQYSISSPSLVELSVSSPS